MRSRLITLRRRSTIGRRKPATENREIPPGVGQLVINPEPDEPATDRSGPREMQPVVRYSPLPKLDELMQPVNDFAPIEQGEPGHLSDQSEAAQICRKFVGFAGSGANARALVTGLHSGRPIALGKNAGETPAEPVSFVPPTGELRYGNVYIALAMAERLLAKAGCAAPTPQQIQAALVGGEVSSEQEGSVYKSYLPGVLQLRSRGLDWRAVAQAHGLAEGPEPGESHMPLVIAPASKTAGGVGGTGALVFMAAGLVFALSLALPAGSGLVTQAAAATGHFSHAVSARSKPGN
jgi:hypothetical protein